MYNFIRLQYILGYISKEQVQKFVPFWITKEQAEKIIKEKEGV